MAATPNDHHHDDVEDSRGLAGDVSVLLQRRRALQLLGGAGLLAIVGCTSTTQTTGAASGSSSSPTSTSTSTSTSPSTVAKTSSTTAGGTTATAAGGSSSCASTIPQETAGPFPGDGSNGPNVLEQSGIVRSDIRPSFGSSTTVATGIPLTVTLKILENAKGCAPLAGAAAYVWHCDQVGRYSLYSQGATNENYLRGVQEAGSDGTLTFQTIFPGAYPGRWPHIHFEIYRKLADATAAGTKLTTSQLALPEDTCNLVYATDGYRDSVANMKRTSLKSDMVFSDGATLQMPTVTGNVKDGFVATLDVTV